MGELSAFAIEAVGRLNHSWFINWVVRGFINDPALGGNGNHPNWRLFAATEEYLSRQQICHAADVFNVYCDSILAVVLDVDPTAWSTVKGALNVSSLPAAVERLRMHKPINGSRKALRNGIETFRSPESDVICELRNKIIHQDADDPDFEVQKEINSKNGVWCSISPPDLPPGLIPIDYDGTRLIVDAQTGLWACRHIQHHIHLMDQNLSARFKFKTHRYRPRRMGLGHVRGGGSLPLPPGTSLILAKPKPITSQVWTLAELKPDYTMVTDSKEIRCAKARYSLRDEIHKLVTLYCEEAGIAIVAMEDAKPGSVLSHTIRGHDLSLVYGLAPSDRSKEEKERLEVRIREQNFAVVLVIFGSNSQMLDVKTKSLSSEAAEHLKHCIDRALR